LYRRKTKRKYTDGESQVGANAWKQVGLAYQGALCLYFQLRQNRRSGQELKKEKRIINSSPHPPNVVFRFHGPFLFLLF
jgi:hypothetical protein